ncbi:hypothetical protein QTP88_007667 [Uroleucon formosanum]
MKLTLKKLEVTQFRLDFEIGDHEASRDVFPDAKLMVSQMDLKAFIGLNGKFHSTHPSTYAVIQILNETQLQTRGII